jgi:hypothetical protein
MELKTVFTTFNSAEANLVRGRLEAAGFQAFIHGELASLTLAVATTEAGGIRVQVPEDQFENARALVDAEMNQPADPDEAKDGSSATT